MHILPLATPLRVLAHSYEEITKWTVSKDLHVFAYSIEDETIQYLITDLATAVEKSFER